MRWSRLPDIGIGGAVLLMAIAMPLYYFDRAGHLHGSSSTASRTADRPAERRADPSFTFGRAAGLSMPLTGSFVTPKAPTDARHSKAKTRRPTAALNTASAVASAHGSPVATASPHLAAMLKATPTSGAAPLTVSVDASGSTNSPQAPIVNVLIDCGTGSGPSEVSKPWITSCNYVNPGTYTVTVLVYDLDTKSSQASATVTAKAVSPSPSP